MGIQMKKCSESRLVVNDSRRRVLPKRSTLVPFMRNNFLKKSKTDKKTKRVRKTSSEWLTKIAQFQKLSRLQFSHTRGGSQFSQMADHFKIKSKPLYGFFQFPQN